MKKLKLRKILKESKQSVIKQKSFVYGSGFFEDNWETSQDKTSPFRNDMGLFFRK